ncbi:hypothetical protein C8A03DRAFT_48125 [Achaetomium macrosporum]|uniref:Dienelactone hydrolase domain-containing protein n=1 Tax=Achaetomium macrosporum TaxID=79813 RepID=A0AAN7C0Z8_9PEZI|nr:hypothetical protein C8A03DRAFT_48125 [Achaetomium macrosporum]
MQAPGVYSDCFEGTHCSDASPAGIEECTFVVLTDAFGWQLHNTRALADAYARQVSRTLTTLSLLPAYLSSLYHTRQGVAHPHVQAFLRGLRADQQPSLNTTGATKIGVAGFCWGEAGAARRATDRPGGGEEKPPVDCGFTAHPSLLTFPQHIDVGGSKHEAVVYLGARHGLGQAAAEGSAKQAIKWFRRWFGAAQG